MVKSLTGTASVHHSVNHISPRPAMKSDRPQLFTRFCSLPPSPYSTPTAGLAIKKQGEKMRPKIWKIKASPFLCHGNDSLVCPALECGLAPIPTLPVKCSDISGSDGVLWARCAVLERGIWASMNGRWKKIVLLEQRHWVSLVLPPIFAFYGRTCSMPVKMAAVLYLTLCAGIVMDFGAYQWSCGTVYRGWALVLDPTAWSSQDRKVFLKDEPMQVINKWRCR